MELRASGHGAVDAALARAARARAAQFTPSASVCIGIDVRVGGTAADFVELPPAGARRRKAKSAAPQIVEPELPSPGHALVLAADSGFAGTLQRAIVPAQERLSNEVARLHHVGRTAQQYLLPPLSNEGEAGR